MYKTKKLLYLIIAVVLAVSVVVQIAVEGLHGTGFYILFGFCGAWLLILFSKRLLAPLLQKSEDYYDKNGGCDDH